MINVLRQSGSAVLFTEQHLHERKRISAIKRATRGVENARALAKKFLQCQRCARVGKCFDQRAGVAPRRKREDAVNQPIGWLNQHCTRIDVRLFSVHHFEQNRADQFTFENRNVEILGDGKVQLKLDTKARLTEPQVSWRNLWKICLLRL